MQEVISLRRMVKKMYNLHTSFLYDEVTGRFFFDMLNYKFCVDGIIKSCMLADL